MPVNVQKEERRLKAMTVPELRVAYAEVYGEETRSTSKPFLIKRILWRLQCNEQGDISERARERALAIANDADLRLRVPAKMPGAEKTREEPKKRSEPKPKPTHVRDPRIPRIGTELSRKYKGRHVKVEIEPDGFRYNGETYPSLSAVAKAVTGSHWNGFRFFGLTEGGDAA